MTEEGSRSSDEGDRAPQLGYGGASKEAHFVAAPLLTAAALSLAGVVAGADTAFRWPGATLILLVITAMTLIFSMQLAYNARVYLFTYSEVKDHYDGLPKATATEKRMREEYTDARRIWRSRLTPAVHTYNVGTLLLGAGVAASLVPPDGGEEAPARWTAAAIVFIGTIADGIWIVRKKP
ncbi:hypothetical protein [Streptomyces sp. S.PB5]|uniref:hypothetical protein n=1 Tax=Streptomyces sp. S.PB5 TaxID=3020844 RepID=UPI0025B24CD8|nr:hypothetical protein [Streptomyces sp. S.PB5]MDN3024468.1 hypothetical protein [Streptomyces sp. S.PB5]